MMACGFAARAERSEYDPAKVSESLKAIFQFGSAATKQTLNANTVTLISGTIGGTYVQFGADLASVLDDGNKLRVLPIVGRGSVQSVADILFLQGVDLGIVRADTLDYLERKGFAKDIKKQFTYVTKLYNEEMHVIAPKSIRNLKELDGKTVSVDLPNGGTFVTALTVFERLGIKPKVVYIEQRIALEKMRNGEIDAVIVVRRQALQVREQVQGRSVSSRDGRLRQAAARRLSAGDTDRKGLSEPDRRTAKRSTPSRFRRCSPPITGRPIPTAIGSSRSSWTRSSPNFRPSRIRRSIRNGKRSRCRRRSPTGTGFPPPSSGSISTASSRSRGTRFETFLKQSPASAEIKSDAEREALFRQFQALGSRAKRRRRSPDQHRNRAKHLRRRATPRLRSRRSPASTRRGRRRDVPA